MPTTARNVFDLPTSTHGSSAIIPGNQKWTFGDRIVATQWVGCLHVPGCRANTLRQFELVDLDLIVARFQSVQHLSI